METIPNACRAQRQGFIAPVDPPTPGGNLRRASKSHPCPVCGRPGWCSIFADGGGAICMRVPSNRPTRNNGHLHFLRDRTPRPRGRRPFARLVAAMKAVKRDPAELADLHRRHVVAAGPLAELAADLGVTIAALRRVGVGWSGRAWSFPMVDACGRVVGLRYRDKSTGDKWAERGGSEGIFGDLGVWSARPPAVLIVEGPTDLAATLDMMCESLPLGRCVAVGRPSCAGGVDVLRRLVRRLRPGKVGILADADEPGRQGADALARLLAADGTPVRVCRPPGGHKDVRAWRRAGGATGADLLALLRRPGQQVALADETPPPSRATRGIGSVGAQAGDAALHLDVETGKAVRQ